MADKRISELTELGDIALNDFIPLVDTSVNETKKVSAQTLTNFINNNIARESLPAGTVLQVVQGTTSTQVVIATGTFTDTGLSATITPTKTTSKILAIVSQPFSLFDDDNAAGAAMRLLRGATEIYTDTSTFGQASIYVDNANEVALNGFAAISFLDSPSTTSATTYKTQAKTTLGGAITIQPDNGSTSTLILMEIAG